MIHSLLYIGLKHADLSSQQIGLAASAALSAVMQHGASEE